MKKEYLKPTIKIFQMTPSQIICGSGGEGDTLKSGSGDDENTPTVTTKWGKGGIWGE